MHAQTEIYNVSLIIGGDLLPVMASGKQLFVSRSSAIALFLPQFGSSNLTFPSKIIAINTDIMKLHLVFNLNLIYFARTFIN